MKTKHYIKLLAPISIFGFIFRILEIMFAIEPETGYFVNGSVIPILFNAYIILAVIFFMSIMFFTKTEQKTVKGRFVKFSFIDNVVTMLGAVFILASSLQTFVNKYFIDGSLTDVKVLFTDVSFYIIVASVFATFFLVQFATSPKTVNRSAFYAIFSLFVPIYYVLRLFNEFRDMSNILSHSYGTNTIVFLSFLTLAFINLSKIFAGTLCRKQLMAFSLCSVFMGTIHLAEFVLAFIPGNPYNISIDTLTYLADIFICIMLIMIFLKISKKVKTVSKDKNKEEVSKESETEELPATENKEPEKEAVEEAEVKTESAEDTKAE